MKDISLKFGNMRKAQDFTLYPFKEGDKEIIVQSQKSIARINPTNGEMLYNTKGCYFHHLQPFLGAQKGQLSPVDLATIKMLVFTNGETIELAGGAVTADNSGGINIFDL